MTNYAGTTAIAGIGATPSTKDSGLTPMMLAVQACQLALDDAGLSAAEVNGMVTFSAEMNTEIEVARNLGIPQPHPLLHDPSRRRRGVWHHRTGGDGRRFRTSQQRARVPRLQRTVVGNDSERECKTAPPVRKHPS